MKTLRLERVTRNLMTFTQPIILEQTTTTRRCFYGELASNNDGDWDLRGTILVERKGQNGWHPQTGDLLSKLKGGDIAKLELRREHVKNFIVGLQVLADAAKLEGIDLRGTELVVGKKDEVVQVGPEHKTIIDDLIRSNHGADFWDALSSVRPDLASQLADAELLKRRKATVAVFEKELESQTWTEPEWERFFEANQWIFGLGLRFQFLSVLQNQANYGGAGFDRTGEQKGEFLMHTEAEERFTVLVEIKRPQTRFFQERPYRSGVPGFNSDFVNAISQVQVNTHTWETEGSKRPRDSEQLAQAHIRTISPRSLLVCGHTGELSDNHDKREAFELLRCNLRVPEIVTFDELFARAKFIVREPAL